MTARRQAGALPRRIRQAVQRLRQRISIWRHNRNWQRGRRGVAMAACGGVL